MQFLRLGRQLLFYVSLTNGDCPTCARKEGQLRKQPILQMVDNYTIGYHTILTNASHIISLKINLKKIISASLFKDGESVEFSGMAVAHLAADPNYMAKTGRILHVSDLAKDYGFVDLDGRVPDNTARVGKSHWLDQAFGKV